MDYSVLLEKYRFLTGRFPRITGLDDLRMFSEDKIQIIRDDLVHPRSEKDIVEHYNEIMDKKNPYVVTILEPEYFHVLMMIIRELDYDIFSFLFCLYMKVDNNLGKYIMGYMMEDEIPNIGKSELSFLTNHPVNFINPDNISLAEGKILDVLESVNAGFMFRTVRYFKAKEYSEYKDHSGDDPEKGQKINNVHIGLTSGIDECYSGLCRARTNTYLIPRKYTAKQLFSTDTFRNTFQKYIHPSLFIQADRIYLRSRLSLSSTNSKPSLDTNSMTNHDNPLSFKFNTYTMDENIVQTSEIIRSSAVEDLSKMLRYEKNPNKQTANRYILPFIQEMRIHGCILDFVKIDQSRYWIVDTVYPEDCVMPDVGSVSRLKDNLRMRMVKISISSDELPESFDTLRYEC